MEMRRDDYLFTFFRGYEDERALQIAGKRVLFSY